MLRTLQVEEERMILAILREARRDSRPFTKARATSLIRSIRKHINQYGAKIEATVAAQIKEAVDLGVIGHVNGISAVAPELLSATMFHEVPTLTLEALAIRRGYGQSALFKTWRGAANAAIRQMDRWLFQQIGTGMQQPTAVRGIATILLNGDDKKVAKLIKKLGQRGGFRLKLDPVERRRLVELSKGTTKKAKAFQNTLKKARRVLADARRIAVTEPNTAYFEADRLSNDESTLVDGVQWNLSGRHDAIGSVDECDVYASADYYGMGTGIFPAKDCPGRPHPYCACWLGPVMRPRADWGKPKPKHENVVLIEERQARSLMEQRAVEQARSGVKVTKVTTARMKRVLEKSNNGVAFARKR